MRTGTPGFVGSRLREAREARGLTQIALAGLIGVTSMAVSQYENGKSSPSPDVVTRFPGVLNMPMEFFLQPIATPEATSTVFARSMSSATAMARTRAERRFSWFKHIVDYLASYVQLPAVRFPDWGFPSNPLELRAADVELAANRLRQHWGLGIGPISNVVHLIENAGGMVSRMELGAETLDALSQWREVDGRPYVVLGADKGAAARSRFDAAHELAHMILHRHVPSGLLRKTPEFKAMEDQAHHFARAFLLPAESFADDFVVPSLDTLQVLKLKWNVSMAAMLMRAKDLGLTTEAEQLRFWKTYARKGYKLGEPLDDRVPPEQPAIPRQALTTLLDQGIQTRATVRSALPYSSADIEELAALPPGFLGDRLQVLSLTLRQPSRPLQREAGATTMLEFPTRSNN